MPGGKGVPPYRSWRRHTKCLIPRNLRLAPPAVLRRLFTGHPLPFIGMWCKKGRHHC